jgi:hypothetical protein
MPFVPRRWTPSDNDRLRSLAKAGMSLRSTAIVLNRSYVAVQSRAAKLNVRFVTRSNQSDPETAEAVYMAPLERRADA